MGLKPWQLLYYILSVLTLLGLVVAIRIIHRKKRALQEAAETKDRFFGIISHDTKALAVALQLALSSMLEAYESLSEGDKKLFLTEMKSTADLQVQLLENLLYWAHLELGTMRFAPETLDLVPLVEQSVEQLALHCKQKGCIIETDLPRTARVWGDRNMLCTAVRNVLSNAIKFSLPGGYIRVMIDAREENVRLSISDRGIGMTGDQIKRAGMPHRQVLRSGTKGEKGSGLGLVLVKSMVEMNGGELAFESGRRKGTKVKITLIGLPNNAQKAEEEVS